MSQVIEQPAAAGFRDDAFKKQLVARQRLGNIMHWVSFGATMVGILALVVLLYDVVSDSAGFLTWDFITNFPSRIPRNAGILAGLTGSVYMILLVALFAFPIGVGAAIYLEEYSDKGWLSQLIEVNINNLAGVPSIVYGLLGLFLFVRMFGLGRSVLAGALTMSLLILPIVIVASREAIRAVPLSIRQAAFGLGATRWQVVQSHVLPLAFPGILTGTILGLSRAIGETAPLIVVGALTFITFRPDEALLAAVSSGDVAGIPAALGELANSQFSVMPIQIFDWTSRAQTDFQKVAAAGIVLLLAVLLTMNSIAIYLRNNARKKVNW